MQVSERTINLHNPIDFLANARGWFWDAINTGNTDCGISDGPSVSQWSDEGQSVSCPKFRASEIRWGGRARVPSRNATEGNSSARKSGESEDFLLRVRSRC